MSTRDKLMKLIDDLSEEELEAYYERLVRLYGPRLVTAT